MREHAQAEANHRDYVEFLARLVEAMRETAGGDEPGEDNRRKRTAGCQRVNQGNMTAPLKFNP